ncbi:MAG: TfoX/Sxy family protein [Candidatus Cloacimonadaceae bacterium]|nr:TfoX/Sxy family protein [Candidatus Cloacimonadaceae bacterium]MDP3113515.1 TfoX/Sxy family protein [Candidatus Cloacimonadaceae bacterium]
MASKQEVVDFLVGQIQTAGDIIAKKMFGEYGVYCDGKMIALVCDDQLFVKPTLGGKEYLGEVEEAPPYPSAKNWFLIPEDDWDDAPRLSTLIKITTAEVPLPRKKNSKQ